jgi:drug/metabolite transporter (DMT)-like permease
MGYLKIVSAILIWSSLGIFIRRIDLPNQCIVFYTSTIAGAVQFVILLATGTLRKARRTGADLQSGIYLVLAPLSFIANTMLFYFAFKHTTITNAVLTHYTAPVFVALLAPMILGEKINWKVWSAITLSSLGLWLIIGGGNPFSGFAAGDASTMGIMAGALSGLAYAFLIIFIRRIARLYPAIFITFVQNGIVTMVLLPFVYDIPLPFEALPYLITLGFVHSTIAPILYVQGFQTVKANEAAILGYFEPVGATLLAFIFFREIPGMNALFGGMLILFSGYMILKKRQPEISS